MGGWKRWFGRQFAEINTWWTDPHATKPPTLVKVVLVSLFVLFLLCVVSGVR